MPYTKEEKRAYFAGLRKQWAKNKAQAEQDAGAKAQWQIIKAESPGKISYYGFAFALYAMRAKGLEGLPYIDAKTFRGWREAGFQVKKGEKSIIHGITWIKAKNKGEEESDTDTPIYPKSYALFHKTQVEAI